jgi:AraC family transcriptional regulator of adaptative response / DNA-3-methyladenine glycosylase II
VARARAAAIRAFARAVVDDHVRLDRSLGLEQLIASLSSLGGVDVATAHYIGLRLGEPDAFPVNASGLQSVVPSVAADVSREVADRWRPWRALAIIHLWQADHQEDPAARRSDVAA